MIAARQSLTIRRRQPADIPHLAEVLVRVHAADGYPVEGVDDPEGWIIAANELAAWSACLDEEPIGHISLVRATDQDDAARHWVAQSDAEYEELAIPVRLFVDPPRRALGAGRLLMLAAYKHAAALGHRIVFDVMLKDRRAIHLYEQLGCQRLGIITHRHSGGLEEPAAVYLGPPPGLANHPS